MLEEQYQYEIEKALLSALIQDPGNVVKFRNILTKNKFYFKENQFFYQQLINCYDVEKDITQTMFTAYLMKNKQLQSIGGATRLMEIYEYPIQTASTIENFYIKLNDQYKRNRAGLLLNNASRDIETRDTNTVISKLQSQLKDLQADNLSDKSRFTFEEILEKISDIDHQEYPRVPIGYPDIDEHLYGGQRNDEAMVIAARPGVGKTGKMNNIILKRAQIKKKGVIFSTEMSPESLSARIVSNLIGKPFILGRDKFSDLSEEHKFKLSEIMDFIVLYDIAGLTPQMVNDIVKKEIDEWGAEYVAVDYLQNLNWPGKATRYEMITNIARELKNGNRENKIPYLILAQLGRDADEKRPRLKELQGSGEIENAMDIICFLHPIETQSQHTDIEFIIAKNRNGLVTEKESILFTFNKAYQRFIQQ